MALIRTAVMALTSSDHILLVNHKKLKTWIFPGGKIEPTETIYQGACREILEETGIDIKPFHINYMRPQVELEPAPWKVMNIKTQDDNILENFVYWVELDSKAYTQKVVSPEGLELEWFIIKDLLNSSNKLSFMLDTKALLAEINYINALSK